MIDLLFALGILLGVGMSIFSCLALAPNATSFDFFERRQKNTQITASVLGLGTAIACAIFSGRVDFIVVSIATSVVLLILTAHILDKSS